MNSLHAKSYKMMIKIKPNQMKKHTVFLDYKSPHDKDVFPN